MVFFIGIFCFLYYLSSVEPALSGNFSIPFGWPLISQVGGLEQHRRTHTGKRPFKCTHCGKRFNQKGHLNEHLARHTEKIPFECDLCGEGFSCKISLTKHKETHTAEAPSETDEQKTVRFSLRELLSNGSNGFDHGRRNGVEEVDEVYITHSGFLSWAA